MLTAFYDPGYFLPLPPAHRFPMEKFLLVRGLLEGDVRGAVACLRAAGWDPHVLVVGADAYQEDGTNFIFRNDEKVVTRSIHVVRNSPARKIPGDYDVPLNRWPDSRQYLDALGCRLPTGFEAVEPDLVFIGDVACARL